MMRASGPGWLLNRYGVPQRVRRLYRPDHLRTAAPRFRTAEAATSTQTRRFFCSCCSGTSVPFSFLSLQLAIVQVLAVCHLSLSLSFCEQNTLTRHIFSCFSALITVSHVTLAQGVLHARHPIHVSCGCAF